MYVFYSVYFFDNNVSCSINRLFDFFPSGSIRLLEEGKHAAQTTSDGHYGSFS